MKGFCHSSWQSGGQGCSPCYNGRLHLKATGHSGRNSQALGVTIWLHRPWSTLVQVMAWRLLGGKPLPEPMLTYWQLDSKGTNLYEIWQYRHSLSRKSIKNLFGNSGWQEWLVVCCSPCHRDQPHLTAIRYITVTRFLLSKISPYQYVVWSCMSAWWPLLELISW